MDTARKERLMEKLAGAGKLLATMDRVGIGELSNLAHIRSSLTESQLGRLISGLTLKERSNISALKPGRNVNWWRGPSEKTKAEAANILKSGLSPARRKALKAGFTPEQRAAEEYYFQTKKRLSSGNILKDVKGGADLPKGHEAWKLEDHVKEIKNYARATKPEKPNPQPKRAIERFLESKVW